MVASTSGTKGQLMKTFDPRGVNIRGDKTPDKRNLTAENGDCQPSIEDKVEQQTKQGRSAFLEVMDSIAHGVEAWLEENTDYSKRMAETTVDIARKLGVPEGEIKRWAAFRIIHDAEKFSVIKSLLKRVQGGFPADQVDNKEPLRRTIRSQRTPR